MQRLILEEASKDSSYSSELIQRLYHVVLACRGARTIRDRSAIGFVSSSGVGAMPRLSDIKDLSGHVTYNLFRIRIALDLMVSSASALHSGSYLHRFRIATYTIASLLIRLYQLCIQVTISSSSQSSLTSIFTSTNINVFGVYALFISALSDLGSSNLLRCFKIITYNFLLIPTVLAVYRLSYLHGICYLQYKEAVDCVCISYIFRQPSPQAQNNLTPSVTPRTNLTSSVTSCTGAAIVRPKKNNEAMKMDRIFADLYILLYILQKISSKIWMELWSCEFDEWKAHLIEKPTPV